MLGAWELEIRLKDIMHGVPLTFTSKSSVQYVITLDEGSHPSTTSMCCNVIIGVWEIWANSQSMKHMFAPISSHSKVEHFISWNHIVLARLWAY